MNRIEKFIAITMSLILLFTGTSNLYVNAAKKVVLSKKKLELTEGNSTKLKVKNLPEVKKLKWLSNKKSVATVSKRGKVIAKKAGKAKITVICGGKRYVCSVTVDKGNEKSQSIIFLDAMGNKQKIKKEKVDKKDVGVKLCDGAIGCFVSDNHFYFCPKPEKLLYNEENPGVFEVCQDKGEKIGSFSRSRENRIINWGKYGKKLYFVLRKKERQVEAENSSEKKPTKIMTVDLDTWETKMVDCSRNYREFLTVFVYHDKIYIQDTPTKLDEIDMNGKWLRSISLKKESNIILQGIVDGKVYYLTWKNNRHVLKSKDLITGKNKIVLKYEQASYKKKKGEYVGAKFYMMGNKLFILEEFCKRGKNKWINTWVHTLYCLPVKNGGKIKRVGGKQNIVACDFYKGNIFYIDSKHLLHKRNLKKGTDKIISKRKLEKVKCTKAGLFVHKYKAREAYDEDAVENDSIYFMDYNGKHVKKIVEIG